MLKAIETRYKGYRFRSRLEARWAVFFDALGLNWNYEREGFKTPHGAYLPDFEIAFQLRGKKHRYFVEVKGDPEAIQRDYSRYSDMLDFGGCLPDFSESNEHGRTGLILLGEIPDGNTWGIFCHPVVRHYKGLHRNWVSFYPGALLVHEDTYLAGLCGIQADKCIEGDPKHWLVETRHVATLKALSGTLDAYKKARAARFEHGECGA